VQLLKTNKMKILLKITSRERPDQCQEAVQSFIHHAKHKENLILAFALDTDDPKLGLYTKWISDLAPSVPIHLNVNHSKNKINAINRGVPSNGWDILVNVSDDQRCIQKDWDEYLIKELPSDTDFSVWSFDGVQRRINTMEIIGREYYERTEYIYNPMYKSFFCDNESTLVAQLLGKQIVFPFVIASHEHQQVKRQPMDQLAKRNQVHWEEDKKTWQDREPLIKKIFVNLTQSCDLRIISGRWGANCLY